MRFLDYVNENYSGESSERSVFPVRSGEGVYEFHFKKGQEGILSLEEHDDFYRFSNSTGGCIEIPKNSCDVDSREDGVLISVRDDSKWINMGNNVDSVEDFLDEVIESVISQSEINEDNILDDVQFFLSGLNLETDSSYNGSSGFLPLKSGGICRYYLGKGGKNINRVSLYKESTSAKPFLKLACGDSGYQVESECSHGRYFIEHPRMSDIKSDPVILYLISGELDEKSILDRLEHHFKKDSSRDNFNFVKSIVTETIGPDMIDSSLSFYKR